jgi:hypothetical protein
MTEYIKKIMKSQHSHHQQRPTFQNCIFFYLFIRSHLIKMNFIWLSVEETRTNIPFRRFFRVFYVCCVYVHKKAIKSPHRSQSEPHFIYVCTYALLSPLRAV